MGKKDHQCHKKPKQQEHEECYVDYDIVVDVTYIEECEYVVITHCSEEHEQVYHNSHMRSANPGEDHGYSSGPYCEDKKEKQCHKHPKENTRKIPKQTCKKIVDTVYIEECEERIYTQCHETHERGHHSTRVVDHHSKVIAASEHGGHQEHYGGHHSH